MHILIWEVSPPPAMKQIPHWSDLSVHAYFNYPCRQSVIEDYLYGRLNSCRPLFFPAGHQAMRWIRGSTKRELFRLISFFAALCLLPCLCQGQLLATSTFTPLTFCSMQMVLLPPPQLSPVSLHTFNLLSGRRTNRHQHHKHHLQPHRRTHHPPIHVLRILQQRSRDIEPLDLPWRAR
jgi:hypothetical protein